MSPETPSTPDGPAVPDVLAPARLGPVQLRNRIIKAATYEALSYRSRVTEELIEFHRRYAAGGVGMTTVAYCAVAPEGRTDRHQLLWEPEAAPGLRKLTEAVHAEGAAVSAQIGHGGPVANPKGNRLPALSPSRQFHLTSLSFAKEATRDDISRITRAHADAARMAADTGFDAVEIHLGHNYLASSFLSPKINHRTDGYGGSLKNRARFAREITTAVREAVGDRIAVLAKLNMDDGVPGGIWLDEAIPVAQWLDADGCLDALELTVGSSLLNPMYLFKGDAPLKEFAAVMPQPVKLGVQLFGKQKLRSYPYQDAYLLEDAKQIRAAVKTPMVLLGGVTDKPVMDRAMAEGFEFVAMARALLREPDLINRIRADEKTRSLCIHCNKCMPASFNGTRCVLVETSSPRGDNWGRTTVS
ncbi:NADH:flavin oxidoreductase [Streptomyces sp. NBC_01387]|uniref:NADH:flavin oxidoreductase n=1 Tax=unclassified Streptomyces TaxID=2593676 RepID=UPI0020246D31|nr:MULTISPECIES: NADH:flavin oxidoreductase [unclassified Streptomyces]MCX4552840.1 NADH:flavin oxidoreductase [Streptomyces sp. NBC_01500]WSC24171.1 NADH:flavin oxidoreductase [Streptomyces sp. NBC_01766]WSV58058.1 NADH:flavin oxidoreductase [Streptomyces sp. NBC_01014]